MQLTTLDSVDQLRASAACWDDLWQRSGAALPTSRAAALVDWLETFAPAARFRALIVEDRGRWLAALPLYGRRLKGMVEVGLLPNNDWCASGELLVDRECEVNAAVGTLASGLRRLPWPLVVLRLMPLGESSWQALVRAAGAERFETYSYEQYRVGTVALTADFAAYEASWSGNHRRHMGKARRRLENDGDAELVVHVAPAADQVEALLRQGFEIEDRGWKGNEGTSVLATPGLFEFFCRQACRLADRGELRLTYLIHRDQPIAFEYGWQAKGRYCTPKVAFDPEFARYTPSQLLRYRLFQRLALESPPPLVDFHGPLADATAKWITGSYEIGTTLVAVRPVLGRAMLRAFRLARAARRRCTPLAAPVPGPVAAPATSPVLGEHAGS